MPIAAILPAVISGGASIVGGLLGSSASKKAANQQYQAAQQVMQMIQQAGGNVANVTQAAGQGLLGGLPQANEAVGQGVGSANDLLASLFGVQAQNLSPYQATGEQGANQLSDLVQKLYAPGGALTTTFSAPTLEEAQQTPGYQFTLSEGLKALKRTAAGSGTLNSGDTAKAIGQYVTNLANTTYGDVFSRGLTTYQTNRTNALNSLNPLFTMTGQGLSANQLFNQASENFGNQAAQNRLQQGYFSGNSLLNALQTAGGWNIGGAQAQLGAAENAGQALMGGANARAAGTVGSTNALVGGFTGAANALSGQMMLNQILGGQGGGGTPGFAYYDQAPPSYLMPGYAPPSGGSWWNLPTAPTPGAGYGPIPGMPSWLPPPSAPPL